MSFNHSSQVWPWPMPAYRPDSRKMPMNFSLPQDIIDTIVDLLGECADLKTLKACSLVAQSCLHPCRRHIFSTITLTATGSPYKWDPEPTGPGVDVLGERFHQLLVESPYITQYVRTLRAHARNGVEAAWMMRSEEFPAVLSELTRLTRLEVGAKVAMRWAECSPALRSALISLPSTTPLRSLRLQTIVGIPTALVEELGALESLTLLDVPLALPGSSGGGGIVGGRDPALARSNLRAVSARGSDSVLEFLVRPAPPKKASIHYARFALLDCQLGDHPRSYLLLSEFLAKTTALTALHCTLSVFVDLPLFQEFLKHARLPQVRTLSFHLQDPGMMPCVYAFVNSLPPNCAVEEIDVLCSLFGAQDRGLSEVQNWNAIGLGLPVRQLRIRFFLEQNHSSREDHDWAESIFSTQLRPRVRDNLLHLITEGRAKIYLHVIPYFGVRNFQEEMVRMRDDILHLA